MSNYSWDKKKEVATKAKELSTQARPTAMQDLLFKRDYMTANQRANTGAFRERTAMTGRRGATTAPGMTFDQRFKSQKYNDSLMYQNNDDGKGNVLHPGIALLNKIKKSKDPDAAFANLEDKDLALVNQGREILGRMMPTENNAGPMGRVGSQPGAMGRVGGVGAYGGGSYRQRFSDRGSSLSSFANPMDGTTRTGEWSSNRARRLAGERRTGYLQSMASQRSTYANRNAAYDKANGSDHPYGLPGNMMEPGWSPGSRFNQAGNMGGEGIGGSGITLGRDGTYRDAGTAKTYREKNPRPTNFRVSDRWDPLKNQRSEVTPQGRQRVPEAPATSGFEFGAFPESVKKMKGWFDKPKPNHMQNERVYRRLKSPKNGVYDPD